jgi:hypothetical protein
MRHPHTASPFRLAIVALQDSDGYVDALLGLARAQIVARRPTKAFAGAVSRGRGLQGAQGAGLFAPATQRGLDLRPSLVSSGL